MNRTRLHPFRVSFHFRAIRSSGRKDRPLETLNRSALMFNQKESSCRMTGESPPRRRFCECRDALDDGEFPPHLRRYLPCPVPPDGRS